MYHIPQKNPCKLFGLHKNRRDFGAAKSYKNITIRLVIVAWPFSIISSWIVLFTTSWSEDASTAQVSLVLGLLHCRHEQPSSEI